ncbi:alpha/beta fold hydrolase [Nonomuraea sp. NPDC003201]
METAASPIVLVHGFWHGSWCWSMVIEELARRGVPSIAVDLEGHGLKNHSPLARWGRPFDPAAYAVEPSQLVGVTATSAASTLIAQLRRIGGGRPCVLVTHSMGGIVATAAAEQAPELIAELVYVAAFAPVSGLPTVAYLASPENAGERVNALLAADPAAVGALRLDLGDATRRRDMREVFYHDVDEVSAAAALSLLSPDAPVGIPEETFTVSTARYGQIPHTYVVCTEDRVVPPALQRRFVTEIDAVSLRPTTVVELATSHSPFLSAPDTLADVLASAHRNRPAITAR